jgi:hypothetical protein
MRITIYLLYLPLILIGGGVFCVAACVLEFIINGVMGYVVVQEPGLGVPYRFLAFGLPMMGSDYFSAANLLLDWLIWCLVFAPLFCAGAWLIRWYR